MRYVLAFLCLLVPTLSAAQSSETGTVITPPETPVLVDSFSAHQRISASEQRIEYNFTAKNIEQTSISAIEYGVLSFGHSADFL